jgi:hypothetical protein
MTDDGTVGAGAESTRATPFSDSFVVTTCFVENNPEYCAAKSITTIPADAVARRAYPIEPNHQNGDRDLTSANLALSIASKLSGALTRAPEERRLRSAERSAAKRAQF